MNRSSMRELAFKAMYGMEIQKEYTKEQLELFLEDNEITDEVAVEYITSVYEGIEKNKEEILDLISKNLKRDWTIDRISKVNLAILKIAIYEIKFNENNEFLFCIMLCYDENIKGYGTRNSSKASCLILLGIRRLNDAGEK